MTICWVTKLWIIVGSLFYLTIIDCHFLLACVSNWHCSIVTPSCGIVVVGMTNNTCQMKEGSCTYLRDIWAWYCGFSLGVIVISTFTLHFAKFDICVEGRSCNTLQYVNMSSAFPSWKLLLAWYRECVWLSCICMFHFHIF